jgi:hypothetical protein
MDLVLVASLLDAPAVCETSTWRIANGVVEAMPPFLE